MTLKRKSLRGFTFASLWLELYYILYILLVLFFWIKNSCSHYLYMFTVFESKLTHFQKDSCDKRYKCMNETSGIFTKLFMIKMQGSAWKEKQSEPPQFRVASPTFLRQVHWLMGIWSWVMENGFFKGAKFSMK